MQTDLFRLHVWGENACFTRPEMKVERVSYDVMTPSAARGLLEAILWKPAIRWQIEGIDVLKPIKWESVRRNEVGKVAGKPSAAMIKNGGAGQLGMYVEDERQQRAGLFLRDVAYIIHARMVLTDRDGQDDNLAKFQEMFRRRATRGQCFHQPYFGCREFAANFAFLARGENGPSPIDLSTDLGWMLHDLDYSGKTPTPRFFRARLEQGRMQVPPPDSSEVLA